MGSCCDGTADLRQQLNVKMIELEAVKKERDELKAREKTRQRTPTQLQSFAFPNKAENSQISKLISEIQAKQSKISDLERQLDQVLRSKGSIQNDNTRKLQNQIDQLRRERDDRNNTINQLKADAANNRKKESELMNKNTQISQLNRKLAAAAQQLKKKELQVVDLRQRQTNLRRSKDTIEKELVGVNSKLQLALGNLQMANRKVKVENDIQKKQAETIADLISKKTALEQEINQTEEARSKAEQACLAAEKEMTRVEKELQKINNEKTAKEKECDNLKSEISKLTALSKDLEKEIANLRRQLNSTPTPISPPSSTSTLFFGPTLDGNEDYKEFLVSLLERRLNMKIAKTTLLYTYDPLNKTNVHKYIDEKENLVVIVKTAEGYLFGGWSVEGLVSKRKSTGDGVLFSLTNRKVFPVLNGKPAVTYDDFYVIFGNSEIRIRSNEPKVFSNFGISNGYYESRGERVDTLIGDTQREIPIETYDLFQLQLREH